MNNGSNGTPANHSGYAMAAWFISLLLWMNLLGRFGCFEPADRDYEIRRQSDRLQELQSTIDKMNREQKKK